jgi:hypothetical protein
MELSKLVHDFIGVNKRRFSKVSSYTKKQNQKLRNCDKVKKMRC